MRTLEPLQIFFELDRPLLVVSPSFFLHAECETGPIEDYKALDIITLGEGRAINTSLEHTILGKSSSRHDICLKQGYSTLQMSYDYYYLRYLQEEYRRCTGYENANLAAFMKKEFQGPLGKLKNQWFFFYDGTEVTLPEIKVIEKNP